MMLLFGSSCLDRIPSYVPFRSSNKWWCVQMMWWCDTCLRLSVYVYILIEWTNTCFYKCIDVIYSHIKSHPSVSSLMSLVNIYHILLIQMSYMSHSKFTVRIYMLSIYFNTFGLIYVIIQQQDSLCYIFGKCKQINSLYPFN